MSRTLPSAMPRIKAGQLKAAIAAGKREGPDPPLPNERLPAQGGIPGDMPSTASAAFMTGMARSWWLETGCTGMSDSTPAARPI